MLKTGCYRKNDIAFWSYDDSTSAADLSTMDLPGVLERIMCEKEVTSDIPGGGGSSNPSAGEEEKACVTQSQCDNKRQEMNIDTFLVGAYPTAGCFSKNGVAYWGTGDGSLSSSPLSGSKERIWCNDSSSAISPPTSQVCQTGPNADPSLNCGGDNSKKYCRLESGVCNNSGVQTGVCEAPPEQCIEIYSPVCGCDNKTYGNGCKANEKGINIAARGECAIPEGVGPTVKTPCLSEQSCDARRKQLNIASFYSDTTYPSKGCFTKNGIAYWDGGGSLKDRTTADLSGSRKRLYCNANGSPSKSLVSKSNLSTQTLQDESTTSSAYSVCKPLMFGSFFNKLVSSNAKIVHERSLQTCTYNVEVLLNGCAGSGTPSRIEVDAPKARLISSVTEVVDKETVSVTEMTTLPDGTKLYSPEYQYTITMSFPDAKAQPVQVVDAGSYASVTPLDQDSCWLVVCGRPFVDSSGHSLLASSFSTDKYDETSSSWLGGGFVLNAEGSSAVNNSMVNQYQHDLLAKEWTNSALGEHASVASFSAFSIALMTNGAPSGLVEASLKAGLDEIKHARISFDIASKLIGKEIKPGPLPHSSHQFDHNLTALALAVAKEGCVDETLSALAAAAEVELIDIVLKNGATEGMKYFGVDTEHLGWIRNELHVIALDESNHSALARRTLDWVCTVDSYACSAAKQSVLDIDKLIRAFQHRFVGRGIDYPSELLYRMSLAWNNIIGEKSVTFSGGTALLPQVVEIISRNRIL